MKNVVIMYCKCTLIKLKIKKEIYTIVKQNYKNSVCILHLYHDVCMSISAVNTKQNNTGQNLVSCLQDLEKTISFEQTWQTPAGNKLVSAEASEMVSLSKHAELPTLVYTHCAGDPEMMQSGLTFLRSSGVTQVTFWPSYS